MSSVADCLPDRFPVGTRYVIEGRGGGEGCLRIYSRYLEFPDGRKMELSVESPVDLAWRTRQGPRGRRATARK